MASNGARSEQGDIASRITGLVERSVQTIRDRSLGPILSVARALVLGVVLVVVGLVVIAVVIIGIGRLLTSEVFNGHVWITDLSLGGIFAIAGVLVMRKAAMKSRSDNAGR